MSCSDLRERSCLAKRFAALFVLGAAVLLNACGGGGIGPAPNKTQGGVVVQPGTVGVTIIPHEVTVLTDGTVHFDAKITGTSNTAVNWTVVSGGGQIDSEGVYTAPSTPGSATIRVASAADPTSTATASITIQAAPEAELGSVVIPIVSAKIGTSQEIQLTASVVGLNVGVLWSVISGGGTITPDGVYTAPSTAGTVTLLATSSVDPGRSATVIITIVGSAPIEVSITPSSASVEVSQSVQFVATVTGTANQNVTWEVVSGGGVISSSGLYSAPGVPGGATVRATSVADASKSVTASVTIIQPVSVSVSPSSTTVLVNQTVQLSATVLGTSNTAVIWEVTSGEGSVSSTGLYTAPAVPGVVLVEATSVADPTESGVAEIIVLEPLAVSISPSNVTVEVSGKVLFTATVAGADDQSVVWAMAAGGGSITSDGVYSAPTTAGTASVQATSVADPTKSAIADIIIADVAVSVAPATTSVDVLQPVQFTATVTGTSDTLVTWTVDSGGGTIDDSGLYVAPAAPGSATVRATSVADSTKSATAAITITQPVAVSVDPTSATLQVSQTQQFTATVTGSADSDVAWTVTSGGGTIDAAGLYTAPATGGSATVRATSVADPTKSASASVTIQDVTVDVAPSSASVLVNGTQQFTATVGGTSNTAVTWDVVSGGGTISAAGLYTAPAAVGSAVIRATSQADSTVSATASVTISDSVAVSIDPASATLEVSQTQQFTATVTGAADTSVTWDVISGAGSISPTGLYTAPNTGGSATVRATSVADPAQSASVTVTVQDVTVDVAPSSASVLVNGTQQFTATVLGTSNTAVTWTVDSGGGTISATGLYTAPAAAGAAVIRATSQADPTQSDTASITINPLITVSVDPSAVTLQVSQTQPFNATVTGTANTAVDWEVISGGGTIDAGGVYTAPNTGGSATVRARSQADPTKFATASITIQDVTISVSPSSTGVVTSGNVQFTATVGGTSNTAVTWDVPSGGGSVDATGLYTAPGAAGSATVRATSQADPSKSASASVTIVDAIQVFVSPTAAEVVTNATFQFTATVLNFAANSNVDWTVESGGGSIDATGLYTAPAATGAVVIRATSQEDGTKFAEAAVSVIAPVAVSVTPDTATVEFSQTQQFNATVTGSANTSVTWAVISGGGTISSGGLYTAPATAGSATVQATSVADPTKTDTAVVTIVAPVAVSVSPSSTTILVDQTAQFTATVTGSGNTAVTWTIDSGVGSINSSGLYTAPASAGSAVIRATSQADPSKSATASVTVNPPVAVSISPTSANLQVSQQQQFTASVTGTGNTAVTWTVTSGGGTVNSTGLYTAPNTGGSATVRATSVADPTKFASANITIQNVTISVSPSSATILVNQTQQFTATVGGTTNTAVTWTIDSGVGSINSSGLYTAPASAGSAVIRATSQADPSKSATASVTVNPPVAVTIDPTSANLQVSQQQQFTATVTGTGNTAVTWTVTSGGGTVNSTGLYTAPNTGGSATVRATSVADPTKFASASITIQSVTVSVSPSSTSVETSKTVQFAATVGGTSNTAVTWSMVSGGGSISSTGLYTAPGTTGSASIRATSQADPSVSATASITIVAPVAVSVSPTSATLEVSQTQQFTATVTGSGNTNVTWTVTSGGGSINSSGLYTAPAAAGTATIRATSVADPTKFASASITINPPVAVSVTPSSATVEFSQTVQFAATVTGTANTNVTWSMVSGGGSINSSGVYTAPATAGTASIRATSVADPTKSATASITIVEPVVVSVSPSSASILINETVQFTATVTGTGNTSVTWTVTSGGGTITSSGLYTAPATQGSATVRATSVANATKFASANITINPKKTQEPPPITISVTPEQATVQTNGTVQFTATVTGTDNTAVNWSLVSGSGSISSSGLYTAPNSAGSATIRATSIVDPNPTADASVTIESPDPGSRLLSASPDPLAFGIVTTGITSSKTLVLTNVGTLAVSVTGATVSGSDFSISGTTFPFSLAAGETRNITIQFAPQVTGSVTGSVSFTSDASNAPTTVTLTGQGVAPIQHFVDLTWIDSTSAVLGYRIYRGTTAGGPYALLNELLEPSTFYTDSTASNGFTYFYVVRAVGTSGLESFPSNEVQAVIPPD